MWDEKYRSRARIWSGEPNPQLIAEAAPLPPGTALDLGCGEGADAIWLASRGWKVTAVDVSAVALERAEAHAQERGQGGNIKWVRQDLATWVPGELFDLVTAQFLHSTVMPWQQALQLAAAAVRTGGTLLIVGHHPEGLPPWGQHHVMRRRSSTRPSSWRASWALRRPSGGSTSWTPGTAAPPGPTARLPP